MKFYLKDLILQKKKKRLFKLYCAVRYRCLRFPNHKHAPEISLHTNRKVLTTKQLYLLTTNFIQNNNQQLDTHNFWFFLYQQHYFSSLFKIPVVFKGFNTQNIIPKSLLLYMLHSVKLIRWKRFYIIHSNEIVEVLFLSLWLKNIKLFMDWMRKYFEKTNLKKHRKLFLLLNVLLGRLVWNYNIFLQLKGLRVTLRGKFGKAGSVRKTRKYIRRGKCSYTSKNIALISQTNVIRTLTGVFAIKFEVFF